EVARRADLSRATARRLLLTLDQLGYVRTDGKNFTLTARILELGYTYLSSLSLPELAQPHLEQLSATVHESTSASVLDGGDIVYVARVAVRRIMTVGINIGTRFPAYATSMGRVLLAGLPRPALDDYLAGLELAPFTERTVRSARDLVTELDAVRDRGWALVDQELELGLRSIAVPIRDASGTVIAAINTSMRAAGEPTEEVVNEYLPALLAAAAHIERDTASAKPAPHRLGR
ncbi:MAG: pobR, partial [Microbacteriaceae bacterium]|nr:pobR [Microbacteriaceae bacterium]